MDGLISYDGKIYAIDIDRMFQFVMNDQNNDKINSDRVVTQSYGIPNIEEFMDAKNPKLQLLSKDISENISGMNETMINIRYDMVKNLLSMIMINQAVDSRVASPSDFDFGQVLAFNTLIQEKIIYQIEG